MNRWLSLSFRGLTILVISVLLSSCDSEPESPSVRFEIRSLRLETRENEYTTDFSHKANIVALGEGARARLPYMVSVRVTRLSGGDPARSGAYPVEFVIVVRDGIGDLELFGGSRYKKTDYREAETWEPEKIRVVLTGFIPLTPISSVEAQSS